MSKSLSELYEAPGNEPGEKQTGVEAPATVETKAETVPPVATPQDQPASEVPPTAQQTPRDKTVPLAAHEDERRKRQDVEKKLDEALKRLSNLEGQNRRQDDRPRQVDPLVEPEAFVAELEYARFQDRLRLSEDFIKDKVGSDQYAAAEQAVLVTASNDPRFYEWFGKRLTQEANPARFTFEIGNKIIEARENADPVKVRQKLKDELRDELIKELGLSPSSDTPSAPAPRIPTSLADARSVGPRTPGAKPIKRRSLSELYR